MTTCSTIYRNAPLIASLAATILCCANPSIAAESPASVKNLTVTDEPGVLAKTIHTAVIPKTPNHSDEPPFMNGEPEHLRVSFDNDKLKDYSPDTQRQLLIYPLASYAVLFKGKEKAEFDKMIPLLKHIISSKSDKGVKAIPMLPADEAFEVFHNHVKYLDFNKGSGVAYLTCYAQDEAPIHNGDFYYTFQGITADGKYYLSLQYPVKAPKLPAKGTAKTGTEYLAKLPDTEFVPSLVDIDKLIKAITLTEKGTSSK